MAGAKTAAPPNLDAFDADGADIDAEESAVARMEAVSGATSGEGSSLDPVTLELAATLQDAKVGAATNGNNYDVKYEVDIEGFVRLAVEAAKGKGGFEMTWDRIHVGTGAQIKSFSATRDADGEMHYRVTFHLSQSEISRSLGRIGTKVGQRGKMVLEPMQGTLGLMDGTQVDLTTKAE